MTTDNINILGKCIEVFEAAVSGCQMEYILKLGFQSELSDYVILLIQNLIKDAGILNLRPKVLLEHAGGYGVDKYADFTGGRTL